MTLEFNKNLLKRREFLKLSGMMGVNLSFGSLSSITKTLDKKMVRPNILLCIADDWGWPHAGAYGDPVVKTKAFDQVAKNGILFDHAYVTSPSCTPSRNSLLTGQYHWRLRRGANLWSTLDVNIPVFPLLLKKAGYHVGHWRKIWGPGNLSKGGYVNTHPAGKYYKKGFKEFLDTKPEETPFCFLLGASDPHRPYEQGSGKKSGMNLTDIKLPKFYPDCEEIRSDISDYYYEVQRFDHDCYEALKLLEENGQLDNTIVVVTSDNGMPFPRCKSNIYDMGVHVPLAMQWPVKIKGNRRVTDFMSLADLAPTFLEVTGIKISEQMTGKSLLRTLLSEREGLVDENRDHVIFGKERHVLAQKASSLEGYPCRGLRTGQYLYILNFAPKRWPVGAPTGGTAEFGLRGIYSDCDPGPTKDYLLDHRDNPNIKQYFELSFGKRPAEELYDISKDPDQVYNVADELQYTDVKETLKKQLKMELQQTGDPRIIGGGEKFDLYPFYHPS